MIMYGTFKARRVGDAPWIDFMEFEFPHIPKKYMPEDLKKSFTFPLDLILTVDWDSSDWIFDTKTGEGSFRAKGIMVNQVYANGDADIFRYAHLVEMQIRNDEDSQFELTGLELLDGDKRFEFEPEHIRPSFVDYVD